MFTQMHTNVKQDLRNYLLQLQTILSLFWFSGNHKGYFIIKFIVFSLIVSTEKYEVKHTVYIAEVKEKFVNNFSRIYCPLTFAGQCIYNNLICVSLSDILA